MELVAPQFTAPFAASHSLFGLFTVAEGPLGFLSTTRNHLHHYHHWQQQQKKKTKHSISFSSPEQHLRVSSYVAPGIMAASMIVNKDIHQNSSSSTSKDLLVVGPGVLGRLVAGLWMKENADASVVGQTVTTAHHDELLSLGIRPVVKNSQDVAQFPYVIFCAPPSGSSDYAEELRLAGEKWNREGVFLFTSSSAVCDCNDNSSCDEDTPIVPLGRSPRTDVLLRAEQEVLRAGGTVLRLAGLYTLERGPHAYYAKQGIVDARPDHILNLIHYEDAASLCVTILKKGLRNEVFLGCDNHPVSRQELMEIAKKSGKFSFDSFSGVDGPLGKRMTCNKTRSRTGWQPKFNSFAEFLGVAQL